jgi:hypothetical protein
MRQSKICAKCHVDRPLSAFGPSTQALDGLKSRCRECLAADQLAYAAKHRDVVDAKRREWREKNPEKMAAYKRAWVERNRDKASASWRANTTRRRRAGLQAEWVRANRGAVTEIKARHKVKRKAAEAAATPPWAIRDVMRLFYIYAEALGMQVDHVVPVCSDIVCGLHCEQNFQLLTQAENASKNNRWWPDMP